VKGCKKALYKMFLFVVGAKQVKTNTTIGGDKNGF
jgi:hypothetical protein